MRALGYYPKETQPTGDPGTEEFKQALKDTTLTWKLRRSGCTPEQRALADKLKRTLVHPQDRAMSARLLEEAQEAPNPMEGFADEAENRLDQELLLFASGHHTRDLKRRVKQYLSFIAAEGAATTEFALKYKERILTAAAAATTTAAVRTYVPGCEIEGDELRTFADDPVISGPLVCQLCEITFNDVQSVIWHLQSHFPEDFAVELDGEIALSDDLGL